MLKKTLVALAVISTTAFSTANADAPNMTKEEKEKAMKCYLKMAKELKYYQVSDGVMNEFERLKIILPMMKEDGFTCDEIMDFLRKVEF